MKRIEFRVAITVAIPKGADTDVAEVLRQYLDSQADSITNTIRSANSSASLETIETVCKDEGVLAPLRLQKAGWV